MTCPHWQSVCTACLCKWRTEEHGCQLGGQLPVNPVNRGFDLTDRIDLTMGAGESRIESVETNQLGDIAKIQ